MGEVSGTTNSAVWMGDVPIFAGSFRVFCVDMIGEAGLSAPSRPSLATDAHARWLDEILQGLSVARVSIVGVSLGGWLALDYATRNPERVERVAALCPGGVGRQKLGIVFLSIALRMCGAWGRRKLLERILGRSPADPPPGVKVFASFLSLIHRHFRPRMVKLPVFSDDALRRLSMPVLAIVGANARQSLDFELHAHKVGALHDHGDGDIDLRGGHGAGHAHGLNTLDLIYAATSLNVLGDQIVDGLASEQGRKKEDRQSRGKSHAHRKSLHE